MTDQLLPALAKAAVGDKLIVQIYGDLAKPGVSQVGKALGAILGLGNTVLWPVHLLNARASIALQANLDKYREKLASVPPNKVVSVPPEIGVPLLEKLAYVSDPDLRELYATLLARASNIETQSRAHPSFVNVLANISPDEALLLRQFSHQPHTPFVIGRLHSSKDRSGLHHMTVVDMHFALSAETKLAYPGNLSAYVSNLEGLGLVSVDRNSYLVPVAVYNQIEAEIMERLYRVEHSEHSVYTVPGIVKGRLDVTPYGQLFLDACVKD